MSFAYFVFLFTLASTTIVELCSPGFATELGTAAAGLCLLAVSLGAANADREHVLRATAKLRAALIAIPICIGAQLIPVGLSLAHPIWSSTNEAVQGFPFGYITADVSTTLAALFLSIAAASLAVAAVALGRDRRRAELILFVLGALTTLVAILRIFHVHAADADVATSLSGFGVILSLTVVQLAAERAETHHSIRRSVVTGLIGIAGLLINGAVMLGYSSAGSAIACALGVALLLLVVTIRRLDLSVLAATAISVVAIIGAALVLAWLFEKGSGSPLLRIAPPQPDDVRTALGRLFADTRWFGAGAGTFSSVVRIYQVGDAAGLLAPPSAAIATFVEGGWIGLLVAIATALRLVIGLLSGALRRGRDSFFPTAAAACLAFAVLQGFAGSGLLRTAVIVCLAAIVGLGLSQSIGQAAR